MIQHIHLTNFQKHRDLSVDFGAGLVALRGANEAGKSTLLRGVSYALFGAKALPQSLDDTVTWGEHVNSLKATLTLSIDGVEYTITRSKTGAELRYDGGSVTGQTETTKFLCARLGVTPDAINQLLVSNQSQIRGALEEGVAATTKLIEKLSNFQQIDDLIELIQTNLPTGNTALAKEALRKAEEDLALAQEKLNNLPDLNLLQEDMEGKIAMRERVADEVEKLRTDEAVALSTLESAQRAVVQYEEGQKELRELQQRLQAAQSALLAVMETAPSNTEVNIQKALDNLQEQKGAADEKNRLYGIYQTVQPLLPGLVGDILEFNTPQEIATEIDSLKSEIGMFEKAVANHRTEKAVAEAKLHHGSCTFCGKDFSDVPEVAEANAVAVARIKELDYLISKGEAQAKASRGSLSEAETAHGLVQLRQRKLAPYAEYIDIDDSSASLKATWKGETPQPADIMHIDSAIADMRNELKANRNYETARVQAQSAVDSRFEALEHARSRLESCESAPDVDLDALEKRLEALTMERTNLLQRVTSYLDAENEARDALTKAQHDQRWAQETLIRCQDEITRKGQALKDMESNNELLKAVRAARPRVADKLWSLVLGAVSRYFSQMRGEESRVTRDADGFKVNGKPVAGLSGSTLDILGLAIRVALVRTFIPTTPFLVLDEPAAACDAERTHNMLGFLTSADFPQVLLVTHEDISEDVAGSLVQIGGE